MDKCIECYELTFSEGKTESDASFRRFCPLHCSIIDDNVKQMLDEEILSQLSTIGQNLALEHFFWKKKWINMLQFRNHDKINTNNLKPGFLQRKHMKMQCNAIAEGNNS